MAEITYWTRKHDANIFCLYRKLYIQWYKLTESGKTRKVYHANSSDRQVVVSVVISITMDFKMKVNVCRDRAFSIDRTDKGPLCQVTITTINNTQKWWSKNEHNLMWTWQFSNISWRFQYFLSINRWGHPGRIFKRK